MGPLGLCSETASFGLLRFPETLEFPSGGLGGSEQNGKAGEGLM